MRAAIFHQRVFESVAYRGVGETCIPQISRMSRALFAPCRTVNSDVRFIAEAANRTPHERGERTYAFAVGNPYRRRHLLNSHR